MMHLTHFINGYMVSAISQGREISQEKKSAATITWATLSNNSNRSFISTIRQRGH